MCSEWCTSHHYKTCHSLPLTSAPPTCSQACKHRWHCRGGNITVTCICTSLSGFEGKTMQLEVTRKFVRAGEATCFEIPWTWRCAIFAAPLCHQHLSTLAPSVLTPFSPVKRKTALLRPWLNNVTNLLFRIRTEQRKVAVLPVVFLCLHKPCHFDLVQSQRASCLRRTRKR